MTEQSITAQLESLAEVLVASSDATLGQPWAWGDYTGEGLRFTAFVALREVQDLTVAVAAERIAQGKVPSFAQRILAQHQVAYRELESLLIGIDDELGGRPPAEGEWSVCSALQHIVEAEATFHGVCRFAAERAQQGLAAQKPDNAYFDAMFGTDEEFTQRLAVPLTVLWAEYEKLHAAAMADLSIISDAQIDAPACFWESTSYPLRFRLGRFEDHVRQHTIQIDRALDALGVARSEGRLLARMLYSALGQLEGALLGAEQLLSERQRELAAKIEGLAGELRSRE